LAKQLEPFVNQGKKLVVNLFFIVSMTAAKKEAWT